MQNEENMCHGQNMPLKSNFEDHKDIQNPNILNLGISNESFPNLADKRGGEVRMTSELEYLIDDIPDEGEINHLRST